MRSWAFVLALAGALGPIACSAFGGQSGSEAPASPAGSGGCSSQTPALGDCSGSGGSSGTGGTAAAGGTAGNDAGTASDAGEESDVGVGAPP